jgi:hypothetical protein
MGLERIDLERQQVEELESQVEPLLFRLESCRSSPNRRLRLLRERVKNLQRLVAQEQFEVEQLVKFALESQVVVEKYHEIERKQEKLKAVISCVPDNKSILSRYRFSFADDPKFVMMDDDPIASAEKSTLFLAKVDVF